MGTDKKNQISQIKMMLSSLNLDECKLIATWLEEHIKLLEGDIAVYNMTIRDLGLSNRAYNILRINGIQTINQLLILSSDWNNVRLLRGVGPAVLKEIQQIISKIQQLKYANK